MPSLELVKLIVEGKLDPRHLNVHERKVVVSVMSLQGLSEAEIAKTLKVQDRTVQRYQRRIRRENKAILKELDTATMASEMFRFAMTMRDRAVKNGDIAGAWAIYKDLIGELQSLKILDERPKRIEIVEETKEFKEQDELFRQYSRTLFGDTFNSVDKG